MAARPEVELAARTVRVRGVVKVLLRIATRRQDVGDIVEAECARVLKDALERRVEVDGDDVAAVIVREALRRAGDDAIPDLGALLHRRGRLGVVHVGGDAAPVVRHDEEQAAAVLVGPGAN